jgi:hypothetical protein
MNPFRFALIIGACSGALAACSSDDADRAATAPSDPDTAEEMPVDRFGAGAMLQKRDDTPSLPGPDEAVDFDQPPFSTRGLGPAGNSVVYYNFDVQPTEPAPVYVLIREGEATPVAGQLNIVDVVPGVSGYGDFWQVMQVSVPVDYEANTVTSRAEIESRGYGVNATSTLVNWPVVPKGSTATRRLGGVSADLARGWYRGKVVHYFSFEEEPLSGSRVPTAPIYVTFNRNPDADGGGPASGFKQEAGSDQTHNVLTALPGEPGYSPLWSVSAYDGADFDKVTDLSTVLTANVLARNVANVNCPVGEIEDSPR